MTQSAPSPNETAFSPNVIKCCSSSQKLWIVIKQWTMYNSPIKPKIDRTFRGYNPDNNKIFGLESTYNHLNLCKSP